MAAASSPARVAVAGQVRAEMARRRITQVAMAAALGMNQAAISRRLCGAIPFTIDELAAVAGVLGIPARRLIPDGDEAA